MSDESTAVATVAAPQQHGLQLRSLQDYLGFAEIIINSGLSLGHKTAPSVVVALQFGAELGFSPIASLRNVHVIESRGTLKPLPSADALVAVALSHPDCLYFRKIEETSERATWETHRRGNPEPTRYSFTADDAKRAQLTGKDNWKNYTGRMLSARAKSYLARDVYPDRLAGILTVEEADDFDGPATPASGDGNGAAATVEIQRTEDADAMIAEPQWRQLVQRAKNGGHELLRVSEWLQKRYGVTEKGKVRRGDFDAIVARLDDKSEIGSKPGDFGEPEPELPLATEADAAREPGQEG